jgi:acyl transferase domain-containing protein
MRGTPQSSSDDVAVIGMSCRFPGDATSPESFFEMLKKGDSAWSEVPKERFDIDTYYHPSHGHKGTIVARGGYFLKEDPANWDAPFCRCFHLLLRLD